MKQRIAVLGSGVAAAISIVSPLNAIDPIASPGLGSGCSRKYSAGSEPAVHGEVEQMGMVDSTME